MSSSVNGNFYSALNLGYLSLTGVLGYSALETAQAVVGAAALKASFVAGVIFGTLLEIAKSGFFKDFGANKVIKNITYFLQTNLILVGIDESMRRFNLARIFKVFEGAVLAHAQSIAFFNGILLAQTVGQIFQTFI